MSTPAPERSLHLLVISAKTATALERTAIRLADDLDQNPERSLADVAWTLQVGRQEFAHRRIVTATTAAEAVARLRASKDPRVFSAAHEGGARPVAFLFSGQGSQYPGMGEALYRQNPLIAMPSTVAPRICRTVSGATFGKSYLETVVARSTRRDLRSPHCS